MRATAAASTAYMYSWVPVSSKWPRRHSMTHAGSSASYAAVRMALHRQADREPLPRRPTQGLRESEPGPLARPRSRPSPRRRSTWANFSPRSTWANFSPRRSRARPRRAPASRGGPARAGARPPALFLRRRRQAHLVSLEIARGAPSSAEIATGAGIGAGGRTTRGVFPAVRGTAAYGTSACLSMTAA